jgi:hypothetical protein
VHVTYKSPKRSVAHTRTRHGHLLSLTPAASRSQSAAGSMHSRPETFELAVSGIFSEGINARLDDPARAVIPGRRVTRRQEKNWAVAARRRAEGWTPTAPAAGASVLERWGVQYLPSGSMLALSSCGGTGGGGPAPPSDPPGTQAGSYSITVSATSDTTTPAPPPVAVQLTVN